VRTRRRFLVALGAGVVVPRRALAQQQSRMARIGFLILGTRQSVLVTGRYDAFVQGMRELGYTEGRNLVIEARFADGDAERLPALTGELVRLKPDVIVGGGAIVLRALQQATATIPIVAAVVVNPVGDGFAASLARPGGNITGMASMAVDLGPKHLDLLKAVLPRLSRVAVLVQSQNHGHPLQLKHLMSAAQKIDIQVLLAEATTALDIEREFAMIKQKRAEAVVIFADGLFVQESRLIAAQALTHRLPSISPLREHPEAGGLMSYGANIVENYRRAAVFVDKILKGAKPGELPFEQPTHYQLVINRKTSLALQLTIPQTLLIQGAEVVQ
jgi:putative tryptophan/tyrosine transport system substrate-binding protein